MNNPGLTRSFKAETATTAYHVAALGSADYQTALAGAATDALIGTYTDVDNAIGDDADVVLGGMPLVKLGGTVARGDRLTSDADGQAVAAATTNNYFGTVLVSGVAGDIVPYLHGLGVMP
ncbi:MAG: hypothetical protein AB7E47_12860 [Desulfovibrionaceae bacterium]